MADRRILTPDWDVNTWRDERGVLRHFAYGTLPTGEFCEQRLGSRASAEQHARTMNAVIREAIEERELVNFCRLVRIADWKAARAERANTQGSLF